MSINGYWSDYAGFPAQSNVGNSQSPPPPYNSLYFLPPPAPTPPCNVGNSKPPLPSYDAPYFLQPPPPLPPYPFETKTVTVPRLVHNPYSLYDPNSVFEEKRKIEIPKDSAKIKKVSDVSSALLDYYLKVDNERVQGSLKKRKANEHYTASSPYNR